MSTESVELEIPVAWGDMDAFGHVNNTVYLRYFESARIVFFERVGIPHRGVEGACAPILARTTCDFRIPLVYPDTVRVETHLGGIGNRSFTMVYRVLSRAHDDGVAAEGDGVIVWFDYAARQAVPIPEDLRARLLPFMR